MPLLDSYKDRLERAKLYGGGFKGFSTAGENFDAAIGEVFDEYSTLGPLLNSIDVKSRNKNITDLYDAGKIPKEIWERHQVMSPAVDMAAVTTDWDGLGTWVNENLAEIDHVKNRQDLTAERNAEMEMKRKYREDIFARARTLGKTAQFGGNLVASGLDPVNIVAGPLLGGLTTGSVAASRALYAATVAGRSAVGGAVSQAAIEPFIAMWQEDSNGEYSLKQAMMNIGMAGVFSASISAPVSFFSHARALKSQRIGENKEFLTNVLAEKDIRMRALAEKRAQFEPGTKNYNRLTSKMYRMNSKYDSLYAHFKENPDDVAGLENFFSELDTLKNFVKDERLLQDRLFQLEKKMETMDSTPLVKDTESPRERPPLAEPVVKNAEATRNLDVNESSRKLLAQAEEAKARKAREAERAKSTANERKAEVITDEAEIEKLKARRKELLAEEERMATEYNKNREEWREQEIIETYDRRIERLQNEIENAKSEDKILELENRITDFEERKMQVYEELPDNIQRSLDKKYHDVHGSKMDKIRNEIKEIESTLKVSKPTDPLDLEYQSVVEDADIMAYDGEKMVPISEIVDREIRNAETEAAIIRDTILCLRGNGG